jgi:Xaa-Pro aminopeptidase
MQRCIDLIPGGAMLVLSQPAALRNSNVEHPYRQDSVMHYLTGFEEPESALLLLSKAPKGEQAILFVREKDPVAELWEGVRTGTAAAPARVGVDKAFRIDQLWDMLPQLIGDSEKLYYHFGVSAHDDEKVISVIQRHKRLIGRTRGWQLPVFDAWGVAGQMRLHKSPEEVERMRAAAAVTRATFKKIYETVRPGQNERDVHGLILGEFLRGGGDMEAYGSIVAGGANACVLHYRSNNMPLRDGELLLVDAGAQRDYYASDVTRTFPVGRKFTPEQKAMYEIVLAAQEAALAAARPGSTLPAIHEAGLDVLVDGLREINLLSGSRDEIKEKQTYKRFFPHNTSHWIGMDVHDVGDYTENGKPLPLAPGMYFSVEPGLYVDPTDEAAPAAFRGIGIRIEDDVLITVDGKEIITSGIAKTVAELEDRF